MIKKVKIENFAGIKEYDVDFELKSIRNKGIEEQVIKEGDKTYSLLPTFLAKNASGKTSFIKAIEFVSRFTKRSSFINEITAYSFSGVQREFYRALKEKGSALKFDEDQVENLFMDWDSIISNTIESLFNETSYAGSEAFKIEVEFHGDNMVKMDASRDDFIIKTNKSTFSLRKILGEVMNRKISITSSPAEVKNTLRENAKTQADSIDFIETKVQTVYHSTIRRSLVHSVKAKYTAQNYIKNIVEEFGFDSLMLLLKKVDPKITSVKENIEAKDIEIYLDDSNSMPIAPSNLSFGTIKLLEIISKSIPLFKSKGVMIIDEIENGLHLSLIKLLVEFYTNEDINIAESQFIMTTHNPLIFERKIVMARNVYMNENGAFMNIKELRTEGRTENMIKLVSSRTYFNDLFWISHEQNPKSTLTNMNISRIINAFADSQNNSIGSNG